MSVVGNNVASVVADGVEMLHIIAYSSCRLLKSSTLYPGWKDPLLQKAKIVLGKEPISIFIAVFLDLRNLYSEKIF